MLVSGRVIPKPEFFEKKKLVWFPHSAFGMINWPFKVAIIYPSCCTRCTLLVVEVSHRVVSRRFLEVSPTWRFMFTDFCHVQGIFRTTCQLNPEDAKFRIWWSTMNHEPRTRISWRLLENPPCETIGNTSTQMVDEFQPAMLVSRGLSLQRERRNLS